MPRNAASALVPFLLALAGSVLPSGAFAEGGASAGNGGNAAVVRDARGRVLVARLLEFAESEGYYGQKISNRSDALEVALGRLAAITRNPRWIGEIRKRMDDLRIVVVPSVYELPDPEDFHPKIRFRGGAFEPIGLYDDRAGILRVSAGVRPFLPPVDWQGFLMHEVLFARARKNGARDSDLVRRVVGLLFQEAEDLRTLATLPFYPMLFDLGDLTDLIGKKYGFADPRFRKVSDRFAELPENIGTMKLSRLYDLLIAADPFDRNAAMAPGSNPNGQPNPRLRKAALEAFVELNPALPARETDRVYECYLNLRPNPFACRGKEPAVGRLFVPLP